MAPRVDHEELEQVHVQPRIGVERPQEDQRRVGGDDVEEEPNLTRVYASTALTMPVSSVLNGFLPLVGPAIDLSESIDINNPERMNIDATCILMLTLVLLDLFGIMARLANRGVKIRDLE